jgi:predicted TIM-barrel fold metal-dependent hydrolase
MVDHHQHLFSPAAVELAKNSRQQPITADKLIVMLDLAGIRRAVVLSEAFWFDSPLFKLEQPQAAVRAENEWTAREVAKFPDRLVAFCSFSPLADYALTELEYCATDRRFAGVKFSFAMSQVDVEDPIHVEKVRRVFQAANRHRMPVVVHVRSGQSYTRRQAETFLERIVAAAPDVPIQIAHLWGGEAFSTDALEYYAETVASRQPVTRNLYFDVAEVAFVAGGSARDMDTVARSIRQIGIDRILYGSDAALNGRLQPREAWALFRARVPLRDDEFRSIASNIAPYLR